METLKRERIKNGWTCQEASDKIGISKSFYWQIENDKRRMTYELAIRVSLVFDTTPDTLLYVDTLSRMKRENRL